MRGVIKEQIVRIETDGSETKAEVVGEIVPCYKCCFWDRDTIRTNSNDVKWWNEAICKEHSRLGVNEPFEFWTDAEWFCADGERRDERWQN